MTRSELFHLVWNEPVIRVAARFGMSDRGFAKLCERHHIPLPGRGYWAKAKADQYPARMPLPRPDQDYEISLKQTAASDPSEKAPALQLQDTMAKLFGTPLGDASADTQPMAEANPAEPEAPKSRKPKIEADPSQKRLRSPAAARRCPVTAGDTTAIPDDLDSVASAQALGVSALNAKWERAIAAGLEYQRHQTAWAFLGAMVANSYNLDEPMASAILNSALAVYKRLSLVDPVGAVISEISAVTKDS